MKCSKRVILEMEMIKEIFITSVICELENTGTLRLHADEHTRACATHTHTSQHQPFRGTTEEEFLSNFFFFLLVKELDHLSENEKRNQEMGVMDETCYVRNWISIKAEMAKMGGSKLEK